MLTSSLLSRLVRCVLTWSGSRVYAGGFCCLTSVSPSSFGFNIEHVECRRVRCSRGRERRRKYNYLELAPELSFKHSVGVLEDTDRDAHLWQRQVSHGERNSLQYQVLAAARAARQRHPKRASARKVHVVWRRDHLAVGDEWQRRLRAETPARERLVVQEVPNRVLRRARLVKTILSAAPRLDTVL